MNETTTTHNYKDGSKLTGGIYVTLKVDYFIDDDIFQHSVNIPFWFQNHCILEYNYYSNYKDLDDVIYTCMIETIGDKLNCYKVIDLNEDLEDYDPKKHNEKMIQVFYEQ